jgi:two-component system, chemotaxis family, chemotaxis protein CheY
MKILIVDDSDFMRMTIKRMLSENQNFELFEAINEDDAVIKYKEIMPDFVLLDIMMKTHNGGIIALEEIKKINPD